MHKKILGIFLAAVLLLPCAASAKESDTCPYRITVNLTDNIVTIYEKDSAGRYTTPDRAFVCSAGSYTPEGTFRTTNKYIWRPLFGNVFGQYATRITGSILFHSVPYLKQDKSTLEYDEYNKLGTTASAGCIRLTAADAKWIYDNCPSGTVVEMYRGNRKEPLQPEQPAKIDISDSRKGWDPTDPDPANPWKNPNAEQTEQPKAEEPDSPPEWVKPLLEETPAEAEPETEDSDSPPEWVKPLLNQTQNTEPMASASAETISKAPAVSLPEAFRLQAAGRETAYTIKVFHEDEDCFLTEQDARQAFAHLGITLLFQRKGNTVEPMVLWQKTLHSISTQKVGGQFYFSLRELAELTGTDAMQTPNGGFSLRRLDGKVWIDPFATA